MTYLDRLATFAVVGGVACLLGCSGDFGFADDQAGSNESDTSENPESGTEETDTEDNQPPLDEACGDADCGGVGTCVAYGDVPVCLCNEGYISGPDTCVPCPTIDDELEVHADKVTLSGSLLFNDEPPPGSVYEDAELFLRDLHGYVTPIGNTSQGAFAIELLPGAYEIVYSHLAGDVLPRDSGAVLQRLWLDEDTELDLDIAVMTLEGNFTINGDPPPESAYEYGELVLLDVATGNEVVLGNTRDGSYSAQVLAGEYEVRYRHVDGGEFVPLNTNAWVDGITIEETREPIPFDIDVPMVPLSGSVTIDGATPPDSPYERAKLFLIGDVGDEIELVDTTTPSFVVNVVTGGYDLEYRLQAGGEVVPANPRARFGVIAAGEVLEQDIDIPVAQISGDFQIGGAEAPTSPYDDGIVHLRGSAAGIDSDAVLLGNTSAGSYSALVIPGAYDIVYSAETVGDLVPSNVGAVIEPIVVAGAVGKTINVPRVSLSGTFTISGAEPPTSVYDSGRVYLRNLDTGNSVLLGDTRDGTYDALVTPGEYGIYFARENANGLVPQNENGHFGVLSVQEDQVHDIDVPMFSVAGDVLVDEANAPSQTTDSARIHLRTRASEDSLLLTDSHLGPFDAELVQGTYDIVYTLQASTGAVPQNTTAIVSCVTVE